MVVSINGKINAVAENLSLSQLIDYLKIDPEGKAIAVNQNVISKNKWNETIIKENDKIIIITATQGG
ncbi:MAG: hypothetical protein Kow0079_03820 [Vicingaceae bacterium]